MEYEKYKNNYIDQIKDYIKDNSLYHKWYIYEVLWAITEEMNRSYIIHFLRLH